MVEVGSRGGCVLQLRYCCAAPTAAAPTAAPLLLRPLLLRLLGRELDHVVDAQHGDGRLRRELDHLDLGEGVDRDRGRDRDRDGGRVRVRG